MEYEDRREIVTPEGVQLAIPLAGLGTRFLAIFIDLLIGSSVALVLILFAGAVAGGVGLAISVAVSYLVFYVGYHVVFEVAGGGRTVGKRAASIRVVMDGGAPVGLRASLVRNVIRILEGLPLMYVPAMISVISSRNNQRLGDHAGGTLVIRDTGLTYNPAPLQPIPPGRYASWDVTGVGEAEVTALRTFLERRFYFDAGARAGLAAELARRLRPLVPGARPELDDESFLEHLAAAKSRGIAHEVPPDGGSVRPSY